MNLEKQYTVAENLVVTVEPNKQHEFLMNTAEVAVGYGVSKSSIWNHKKEHEDELIENKHYLTILRKPEDGKPPIRQLRWTKRGIVRLGFFIKSKRAKLFRDWAEDLVIFTSEQIENAQQLAIWPEVEKRKHNRLTQDRLVGLLADVARIEDKELRLSIVNKLLNNH